MSLQLRTSAFIAGVAALTLLPALPAQLPPHHFALGTAPTNGSTTPGLFFVSQKTGATTRVTGLPPEFTAATGNGGVWDVVRRPDEKLVLGTGNTSGNRVSISMVTLAGSAVVSFKRLIVGTIPNGWQFGLGAQSVLPDGKRILFAVPSLIYGPMNGYRLGIADFDAATPTITPIPLTGQLLGTFINHAEVSRDGKFAIVQTHMGNADARPIRLYQVDLQSGATALLHQEPAGTGGGLAFVGYVAPDEFYVTSKDQWATGTPRPTAIMHFKLTGFGRATITRTTAAQNDVRGEAMDPVTGLMWMKAGNFRNSPSPNAQSIFLGDPKTGQTTLFARPPAAGWGNIRSIALHSTLDFYGPTPHAMEVGFDAFPNAGGDATAGNANFSLTLSTRVTTTNATALAIFGATRVNVPLLSTSLLVDPLLVVPIPVPTPSTPHVMPLPIPSNTPVGTQIHAQWALCEAGTCRASRGVTITTR